MNICYHYEKGFDNNKKHELKNIYIHYQYVVHMSFFNISQIQRIILWNWNIISSQKSRYSTYTHRRSHLVLLKLYAPHTKYIWVFVNNQYLRKVHSLVII